MIRLVQGHRKISEGQICFPSRNDFASVAIDYRHMTGIGNIDENSATVFLQLKSFGMCVEFDRADLFSIGRINNRNASTAKSEIDFFRHFIVTDIVGIIFEAQFPKRLERFSIVDFEDSIFIVCNKETIEIGDVNNSLWRTKTGDRVNSLAFVQIEHFDSVVTKRADEQSFARRIDCEVIDATFDSRQRDRLLEFKGFLLGAGSHDATARCDENSAAKEQGVHLLP